MAKLSGLLAVLFLAVSITSAMPTMVASHSGTELSNDASSRDLADHAYEAFATRDVEDDSLDATEDIDFDLDVEDLDDDETALVDEDDDEDTEDALVARDTDELDIEVEEFESLNDNNDDDEFQDDEDEFQDDEEIE
ncbi:hypothetical protein BKA62DRAFT_667636 [Auriculariales sp. MPI-PUGE-AT-0066]|nr:hypothetical protein BKA62DRAFT_667636 [Auriculariales sp. MPI-PUGE-AT-0066]